MVERLAVEQGLEDPHRLDRAGVARRGGHRFARHVGGDDVDLQSATRHPVDRGDLARELRWPGFADAHRHQQIDPARRGGDRSGEGGGVDAQRITGRQQHIVEPAGFRLHDDVAAMLPARPELRVGHAEEFIIVVAQGGEPADLARRTRGHGSRSPRDAINTSYQLWRVQRGLKASAISAMRVTFCVPTIGIARAGCAMIQL